MTELRDSRDIEPTRHWLALLDELGGGGPIRLQRLGLGAAGNAWVIRSAGACPPSPLSWTAKNTPTPTRAGSLELVTTPLMTAMLPTTSRQSMELFAKTPRPRLLI